MEGVHSSEELQGLLKSLTISKTTTPLEFVNRIRRKLLGDGADLVDATVKTLGFIFLKGQSGRRGRNPYPPTYG